jgi:hypothetical protein
MDTASPTCTFSVKQVDRRRSHRAREFRTGLMIVEEGSSAVGCLVRDMSVEGMQLRTCSQLPLPEDAYLLMLPNRVARRVHFVWRRGSLTGARIVKHYVISRLLPPHLAFLRDKYLLHSC